MRILGASCAVYSALFLHLVVQAFYSGQNGFGQSNDVFLLVTMLSANHLTSPEVSYWLLFCLALFFSSRQDVDDLVLSVDRRGGSEQPN